MLYYNFDGYEGFCCRFGFIEHDNGKTSRRNKILLDFIKDKRLLHESVMNDNFSLLNITNMADLKKVMFARIMDSGEDDKLPYEVLLMNYSFRSSKYETDMYNGICVDGDSRSCRYINHDNGGKVFKMKAGKFIRQLIQDTSSGKNYLNQWLSTYRNASFRTGRLFLFHHNRRKTAYSWMTISGIFTIQTSAMETSTVA